ncbi:hypothetical protein GCM10010358_80870 [Streptomyces minutiscleroticus]|uniref:Bacterial transcriptional activator domain-containing protein n=1 Tax=Streptomyces minutiscleroticus TaxID=68238 RepID=A0A918P3K3_9ACTN|nr:BTAD domain-containing putative transcriptional regulator [Streptomyces minutiscleroticus]GGY17120.1 hypothetical protein GCM10010358_80870 [Streptomyces minutiscleroticus]
MVQNSVAGLRKVFRGAASDGEGVSLDTTMPGYILRIEPEQLDLTRFHELVTLGRAHLAAGDWAAASRQLRDALALWRGPALADVADSGITWPELTALRGTRLAVYEDCFQAELALGRDRELIDELEALLEAEPTRERLVAQLMVALYNCGRQPEALARYRRARDLLAHRFGLEPGRNLQRLQHAILSHDPALALKLVGTGPAVPSPAYRAPASRGIAASASTALSPPRRDHPPAPSVPPGPDRSPRPYRESWERVECRRVSVVMVRTRWTTPDGDVPSPGRIDHAVKELTSTLQEQAAHYGGSVRRAFGSVWMIIFGAPRAHEDDPERAVRAALALRRRLVSLGSRPGGDDERLTVQLVVGTGEVVVTYDDSAPEPVEVTGEVLDSCHQWLPQVPSGEVWACDATVEAVGSLCDASRPDGVPGAWRLTTSRPRSAPASAEPAFLERTRELHILRGAYQDAVRRRLPHLVTVVGEPGIGKTRLIGEFTATLRADAPRDDPEYPPPRVLYAAAPAFDAHTPYEPLAGLVRGCAGVRPGAAGAAVLPALAEAVARLLPHAPDADRTVAALAACLGLPTPAASPEGPGGGHEAVTREEVLDAVRSVLEETAAEHPLVVVLDDFHRAADFVRGFVEDLTVRLGPVGLLLVVGARSELLHASPGWGCAKRRSSLITVAPLSATATHALIEAASGRPQDAGDRTALADGNPLFAQEYARTTAVDARHRPVHPPTVRAVAAAQLDTVDSVAKSVLRDAAVVGETLWRSAVGAVSLRESEEVTRVLEYLESRDLLRRVHRSSIPGDIEYAFRYPVTRDVVLAQLPGRVLLERHLRAANWASLLDSVRPDLLALHYDRAIALAEADGAPVEALERQAWEALVAASARAAATGDDDRAVSCLDYALDRCPPGEPERTWLLTHRARMVDSLADGDLRDGGGRRRTDRRLG